VSMSEELRGLCHISGFYLLLLSSRRVYAAEQ
jgi:hypothetical protein